MAKKPSTSSRVPHDNDVPDDVFVGTIRRLIAWGQQNQQQVLIGGVAVALLALAGVWFITSQRSVEAAASNQLAQVQQSVASGNTQLAIRDLQSFLSTYGSTEAADQARITLASLLLDQGQSEDAIDALGNLPERLESSFGLPAARLEASALETLDRYDDAVEAYLTIAENARFDFQRRESLADAARVRLQTGSPAEAAELYQRVLDTFAEDETGQGYYRMWLAEARAQATGQGTPAGG